MTPGHDSGHDLDHHTDDHAAGHDSGAEDSTRMIRRTMIDVTDEAQETTTEAGGESAALRVTGDSENRLSSEPFEAAHDDCREDSHPWRLPRRIRPRQASPRRSTRMAIAR